jgi:hypothetical protein
MAVLVVSYGAMTCDVRRQVLSLNARLSTSVLAPMAVAGVATWWSNSRAHPSNLSRLSCCQECYVLLRWSCMLLRLLPLPATKKAVARIVACQVQAALCISACAMPCCACCASACLTPTASACLLGAPACACITSQLRRPGQHLPKRHALSCQRASLTGRCIEPRSMLCRVVIASVVPSVCPSVHYGVRAAAGRLFGAATGGPRCCLAAPDKVHRCAAQRPAAAGGGVPGGHPSQRRAPRGACDVVVGCPEAPGHR